MEEKLKNKPLSLLEIVRKAVKETEEEERELKRKIDSYFHEMIKEHHYLKDNSMNETDAVFKFRKESISFLKKLIDKKEIAKKILNSKKEINDIETKIEYLDIKHNELKEEKLNINKEIAEIENIEKNLQKQFDDLGGEDWEGPPTYFGEVGPGEEPSNVHINWGFEGTIPGESGWSDLTRQIREDYRKELKKPLPIGSGICYVLSVPENHNWSKIGFTTKTAQERADDYSKQHDLELNVAGIIADDNAAALEKILHEEFSSKRVKHGSAKEIFAVSPQESIKKIKSYKRKISEEMQNRQLLLIGSELLKIRAKIAKETYKISSIDQTIAIIISEQRKLFREKLKKIYYLKISLNSRKRWYRFFGWKARLRRYTQLSIYSLLGVILLSMLFSLSLYLFGKVTFLITLIILIIIY